MQASVGSQCPECQRAARAPATVRLRRWNAARPALLTSVIVALNVAVFVAGLAVGGGTGSVIGFGSTTNAVQRRLGLFGPAVANGEWYRLVTSGFVHFGLLHLGMNMLIIWQLGGLLERALGRVRFGLVYLASLLAGSAGALLLDPKALTAGASGAAFGLAAAAAVALHRQGLPLWRNELVMLLGFNLLITFTIPGISVGGHLGGLIGGGICGFFLLAPRRGKRPAWESLVPIVVMVVAVAVSSYAVG